MRELKVKTMHCFFLINIFIDVTLHFLPNQRQNRANANIHPAAAISGQRQLSSLYSSLRLQG